MDRQVQDLLESLESAETLEPHWALVDAWVRARDLHRLRETALALTEPSSLSRERWGFVDPVFNYLMRHLALTPDAHLADLVRQIARRVGPRFLASLVAAGQSFEVIASLVASADPQDEEFTACLVQEVVLRRERLEDEPFTSFWFQLREESHALAWLPLHLLEMEKSRTLPYYAKPGEGASIPVDSPHEEHRPGRDALIAPLGREITSALDRDLIATAPANWVEESNGEVEAAVFEVADGGKSVELAEALAATRLRCLAGATDKRAKETTAAHAFQAIFSAASAGGAYNHGRLGAYGRLEAWMTIVGLVGVGPTEPFERAQVAAERARWFWFDAESPWFQRIAWDLGIATQRPDTPALAVLAATDAD